jgi:exodeoxyribonuclease-3
LPDIRSAPDVKIASWNVNSVKVRLPHLLSWVEEAQPDVLCLQETKCPAADFPRLELEALGYRVETIGQRAYNGVALVSKRPAEELVCGLPGMPEDEQARYICQTATRSGPTNSPINSPGWNSLSTGRAICCGAKSRLCSPAITTFVPLTKTFTTR